MTEQNGNSDGDGGGSGPWGNRNRRGDSVEDRIRRGQETLKQLMPNGGPGFAFAIAALALLGFGAWSAYYTVPSDSVAVVQRFGQYLKEVPPGLHFKLPFGADTTTIVPVKRQLKQEFGFSTPGANDPYQSVASRDATRETQMVTGGPERRPGRMGHPVSHFQPAKLPVRSPRSQRDAALCLGIRDA